MQIMIRRLDGLSYVQDFMVLYNFAALFGRW